MARKTGSSNTARKPVVKKVCSACEKKSRLHVISL